MTADYDEEDDMEDDSDMSSNGGGLEDSTFTKDDTLSKSFQFKYFIEKRSRHRGLSGLSGGGPGGTHTESRQRRLEKNRESARESRKRKKNYISSLEAKMQGMESEITRLRNVV